MATKLVVDCSTGVVTEVELTAEEIAEREAAELAKAEAKASALGKLAALGLTEDEITAIVG